MMTRILAVGGDRRQTLLVRLLGGLGQVDTLAVPDCRDTVEDRTYDLLVLPCPTLDPSGNLRVGSATAPYAAGPDLAGDTKKRLVPGDLLPYCGPKTRVFGGGLPGRAHLPVPLERAEDLLADPRVKAANGRLTAESVFFLPRKGKSLSGARCLIFGWGCIAKPLSLLLRAFGAQVTVAARRETARAEAEGFGLTAVGFSEIGCAFDFVYNTVPAQTLSGAQLAGLGPDCQWVELASAPGGLPDSPPAELARVAAGGLPGRYLPDAAAKVLFAGIVRALEGSI